MALNTWNIDGIPTAVNVHNNILLIGPGETNYQLNRIAYFDHPDSVYKHYGSSNLSDAFQLAKSIGAPHVFIMNVRKTNDYFTIHELLKQYDFSYVVFTDLYFRDSYFDASNSNKQLSILQYIMEQTGKYVDTNFFITDKHASLYENIDAYLTDMVSVINSFKKNTTLGVQPNCLYFVANNLTNHKFANVALAAALCAVDINEYPLYDYGPAIFDIDGFDVKDVELIYFKNNINTTTTAENLLNFRQFGADKILTIDRIAKYIKRELDFTEFKGRFFNAYQRYCVEKKLTEYLEAWKDYVLVDYDIISVVFYPHDNGTGDIVTTFDIWPKNCIEKLTVIKEA